MTTQPSDASAPADEEFAAAYPELVRLTDVANSPGNTTLDNVHAWERRRDLLATPQMTGWFARTKFAGISADHLNSALDRAQLLLRNDRHVFDGLPPEKQAFWDFWSFVAYRVYGPGLDGPCG
jgi:hypothetical protein